MNVHTKYNLWVIVILLEYLVTVMSFDCYVGENSDYQALRCLSCQVQDPISIDYRSSRSPLFWSISLPELALEKT